MHLMAESKDAETKDLQQKLNELNTTMSSKESEWLTERESLEDKLNSRMNEYRC